MGCDIHGMIEVKTDTRWKGIVFIDSFVERNYPFFAAYFDVRNDNDREYNAMFPRRGLPDDIGYEVQDLYEKWEGDAHSKTHFYIDEVPEEPIHKKENGEDIDNIELKFIISEAYPLLKLMRFLRDEFNYENVRCVVWFDN